MPQFQLEAPFKPCGDQARPSISWSRDPGRAETSSAARRHRFRQDLHDGQRIERVQKPTLVLVHNKTLAGQLYQEFKQFFPHNAVEYFISYYDYYQPEAYIPQTDTYIAKDASINDAIDQMRHAATTSLLAAQ